MEQLNSFVVDGVSRQSANVYVVDCRINEEVTSITARVTIDQPVFGLVLPDEFTLLLRNYPQQSRQLTEIIKNHHRGLKIDLPTSLISTTPSIQLEAA